MIDGCQEKRERERRLFDRSSSSLLAYMYPMDLYTLMATDWPHLAESLLGRDKQGWAVKFSLLAKVRTPLAHNREEAVSEAERVQAEGVCREILQRHESSKTTP